MHSVWNSSIIVTLAGMTGPGLAAVPAHAQNLVQDGGFEAAASGFASAGAPLGDGFIVTQGKVLVDNGGFSSAHGGSRNLDISSGAAGANTVRQAVTTTTPGDYTFTFYAANDTALDALSVQFGSFTSAVTVPVHGVNSPGDYTPFTYIVPVTTPVTALSFTGIFADPNSANVGIVLDDVSVTGPPAPAAVPEPSSVAAFACGALGLAGLIASKHRKTKRETAV